MINCVVKYLMKSRFGSVSKIYIYYKNQLGAIGEDTTLKIFGVNSSRVRGIFTIKNDWPFTLASFVTFALTSLNFSMNLYKRVIPKHVPI